MNPQHWIHLPICSHLGSISCLDPDPYRGQDQDPYLNKKYKDPQHWVHELITKALTVCTNKTTLVALIAYVQWCGSALIVCGSGSTKFYQCGSGSRPLPGTIKSQYWFQAIFYKSRKKSFQICAWTLKINYFFRFRLEKYNFLGKINEDPTDSHRC